VLDEPHARAVLAALQTAAAADERIAAVTLGGSAVTGTMDAYSDLDVVLICRDGDGPGVVADLSRLAAGLGPLLAAFTGEHVGEPRLLIALYGPPALHVDLKAIEVRDLPARVEDGAVLWERDGAVAAAMAAAPARWPPVDPQWIEDRYWPWIHYCAAKVARGELLECIDGLAMLRGLALGPLVSYRAGRNAQGVRRLERDAPEKAEALAATIGDHSRTGCLRALHAAVAAYRRLRPDGVERRAAAEHEAVAFLDALG
jgi:hypothetical protein